MRIALTMTILVASVATAKGASIPQTWIGDWVLSEPGSKTHQITNPELLKISADARGILIEGESITTPDGSSIDRFFVNVDGRPALLSPRCEASIRRRAEYGFDLQISYKDKLRHEIATELRTFVFSADGDTVIVTRSYTDARRSGRPSLNSRTPAAVRIYHKLSLPPAGRTVLLPA